MIEDRHLNAHTYSEPMAQKIYKNLPDYIPLYEGLLHGLYGLVEST